MDQAAQPWRDEARPVLTYDGRIGGLYRVFLINLLFTIITLGIFRFWAITRMRRYVWAHLTFQGERLEYTGRGLELFVGYLLAGLMLFAMAIVAFGIAYVLADLAVVAFGLFYLGVIVLALGAPFSAQRYRLSRTNWRGIRGGMNGSMWAYGLRALLYSLLLPLTLFQLAPWVQLRLAERRINASHFGNAPFAAQFQAGRVYGAFVATFLGIIALYVGIAVFAYASVGSTLLALMAAGQQGAPPPLPPEVSTHLIVTGAICFVAFAIGAALITAWYQALYLRHMADRTRLGDLHFAGAFTGPSLLRLYLGNALILLFTLGLGYPITVHRMFRYMTTRLLGTGALDEATLVQSPDDRPRFGEGMFQQLDHGGAF